MKKTVLLSFILFGYSVSLLAQTPQEEYEQWKKQQQSAYDHFKETNREAYEQYRKKANEEYAQFKKENWAKLGVHPAENPEPSPKPPRPKVAPLDKIPVTLPLPHPEVTPLPMIAIPEVPMPIIDIPAPQAPHYDFLFYRTKCSVETGRYQKIVLPDLSTESLGNAWRAMADESFNPVLRDCLEIKKRLRLDDWGYIDLIRQFTIGYMGKENNEAVLMQQFLLLQSGLVARLGIFGDKLAVLVPFHEQILGYPYVLIDDVQYFVLQKMNEETSCDIYDMGFENERQPTIQMTQMPLLEKQMTSNRHIAAKQYPALKADVAVNKNLIDFMNARPWHKSFWNYYALASLSEEAKAALYPKLKAQIAGKSQLDAANMLLDFVQSGFEYANDREQFGQERSLFADESLFYPYNDCEDRSIFYSILVKDLLHLDVVLLHFKGHMATAVRFTTTVGGIYLELEDGDYVVCDPTYIGAPVGMAMPECEEEGSLLGVWTLK